MEETPEFFDCSGFVKYAFGQIGIELPRSTIEQAVEGETVEQKDLKPGDLIFVHGTHGHYNPEFPEGIGHVGIYTGEDTVIHAAARRTSDKPIIEKGQVIEHPLKDYLSTWNPVIVIKRIIR